MLLEDVSLKNSIYRMCNSALWDSEKNLQDLYILSTSDKNDENPHMSHISVFDTSLTRLEEAQLLTNKEHGIILKVSDIIDISGLGVKYFLALLDGKRDIRSGAYGHCGITGLLRPANKPRKQYRKMRKALGELSKVYIQQFKQKQL